MTDYLAKAKQILQDHPFVMLSKLWCPDCVYANNVWSSYGVTEKIHLIELDKFPDQEEAAKLEAAFTEISGRKWVPTIFFHGKKLGTEQDLKNWSADGTLDSVFKENQLI